MLQVHNGVTGSDFARGRNSTQIMEIVRCYRFRTSSPIKIFFYVNTKDFILKIVGQIKEPSHLQS